MKNAPIAFQPYNIMPSSTSLSVHEIMKFNNTEKVIAVDFSASINNILFERSERRKFLSLFADMRCLSFLILLMPLFFCS